MFHILPTHISIIFYCHIQSNPNLKSLPFWSFSFFFSPIFGDFHHFLIPNFVIFSFFSFFNFYYYFFFSFFSSFFNFFSSFFLPSLHSRLFLMLLHLGKFNFYATFYVKWLLRVSYFSSSLLSFNMISVSFYCLHTRHLPTQR